MSLMKWSTMSGLVAAFALACLTPSAASAATSTSTYQIQGSTGFAFFELADPDGCTFTEVYLHVNESRSNLPPGAPQTRTLADLQIIQTSECDGYQVLVNAFGSVEIPAGAFDVQGNLSGATLEAAVPVFDYVSGQTEMVTVSLSWTGVGDVIHDVRHERYVSPEYKYTFRSNGSYRTAQAAGSLVFRGTDLAAGGSSAAELADVQSGQVSIETF
jgi:hypothetical protein